MTVSLNGRFWLLLAGISAGLALSVSSLPADAEDSSEVPIGTSSWHSLEFRATKFLLTARTRITVDRAVPVEDLEIVRELPEGDAVPIVGKSVTQVSVRSRLPFGRRETVDVYLDGETGSVLQLEKLVTGKKPYWKRRRFTNQGFFRWRSAPGEGQARSSEPGVWTNREQECMKFEGWPDDVAPRAETYSLLLRILDRLCSSEQERDREIVVASKTGAFGVTLESIGSRKRRVSFEERAGERRRTVAGEIEVDAIGLRVESLGDGGQNESFEVLGLRGDIVIYVARDSGWPVEIEGDSKGVGRVRLRLRTVVTLP